MYIVQPKNKSLLIAFFGEIKNILSITDLNFCSMKFFLFNDVFLFYRTEIRVM